ncbi:MAG: hypothetical protein EAX96_16905 [Candidatus Lokiarchaeota archaeon]|nr:hypothetical protein [Candidatus Lokiarchaeota archaeon]
MECNKKLRHSRYIFDIFLHRGILKSKEKLTNILDENKRLINIFQIKYSIFLNSTVKIYTIVILKKKLGLSKWKLI